MPINILAQANLDDALGGVGPTATAGAVMDAELTKGVHVDFLQTAQPLARNSSLPARVRTGTRVRSCGAYGGSWVLPKIGLMFAVDRFCRLVACMQGGLQLCAAVA